MKIKSFGITIYGDGWTFTTEKKLNIDVPGSINLEDITNELYGKMRDLLKEEIIQAGVNPKLMTKILGEEKLVE